MPGMLDTVLNQAERHLGRGLTRASGDARFAWDSYRRLVQMFGEVVRGVSAEAFEDSLTEARRAQGAADDIELTEGR